jgi:iron(III) transport system permease protein
MPAGRWFRSGWVLAIYVAVVLLPVILPFTSLVTPGHSVTTDRLWEPALHTPLMARSLKLATTVTVATLTLALPLALLLYRTRLPLRSLWLGALLVPLLAPPYILGMGVLHLLTPRFAIGFVGSAVTLTIWLLPLALLFTGAGLRLVTRTNEEAALLDTTPASVFRRVTLPMALPHVLAGGLLVFVLALGEFGVPVLFQYQVYPGAIFAQFAAFYDFRRAVLASLPLIMVVVVAVTVAQGIWSHAERESEADQPGECVGAPPGHLPVALALGAAGPYLTVAIGVVATVLLLPLLRVGSGVGGVTVLFRALHRVWLQALQTFGAALLGAGAAVVLALLLAWVATRLRVIGGRVLLAAQLPIFAVPAVLVGIGLIRLWNAPDWRGVVYTSPLILVLGYLARFTPLLIPLLAASYRQIPRELDEAAQLDGAGPMVVLGRIHVPLLRPILVSAGLLVFVLSVGEVPVSILVAPPGQAPLAVRFFTLITNAPSEQVAALAVITTLLALLPVVAWLILEPDPEPSTCTPGRPPSGSASARGPRRSCDGGSG